MLNWIARAAISAGLLVCSGVSALAQETASDPWTEASRPLQLDDSRLSGPGAEWLIPRLADAQSVLVGEQHGVDGLARFTASVEAIFQPDALVLEAGPWMGERLTEAPVREALAEAPYSLAFDYNGDIALLEQFQLRAGTGAPIWGVDQEANAIHPFAWLADHAASGVVRRTARGLHLKAALDGGEYTRNDHQADLDALAALDSRDLILASTLDYVSTSMNIFVTWRSGARGEASAVREQYMIDNYQARRAEFESTQGAAPRILFKMGGAHIMEGDTGPNGIMTLGEHVQRRSDVESASALHLGVRSYSPEHTTYPIAELIEGQAFLLLDTTPLRTAIEAGVIEDVTAEEQADIYGYDALVFINPFLRASKSEISALQSEFRTNLLTGLGLSVWPAVLLILFLLVGLGGLIGRILRGGQSITGPALTLTVSTGIILTIFTLQILALMSGAAGAAGLGPGLLPWLAPILGVIALIDTILRGRSGRQPRFISGLIWAALLLWLGIGMHYWNFGGMLA